MLQMKQKNAEVLLHVKETLIAIREKENEKPVFPEQVDKKSLFGKFN